MPYLSTIADFRSRADDHERRAAVAMRTGDNSGADYHRQRAAELRDLADLRDRADRIAARHAAARNGFAPYLCAADSVDYADDYTGAYADILDSYTTIARGTL